jgi:sulfur-oxidizing protein SoxX
VSGGRFPIARRRAAAYLGTAACASLCAVALPSAADPGATEVTRLLQRDFHARGQAAMDRVVQDGLQHVCTATHDKPPEAIAKTLEADQLKTIVFPAGSLLGDWKRGEKIAQSGRGMMWNDKPGGEAGGSCYNCHQISPQELSYGTIGPSLLAYGKRRGSAEDAQRFVYGKIYNAKAYNACSQMPRLGYSHSLGEQDIKDLTALLLDPGSPVNK